MESQSFLDECIQARSENLIKVHQLLEDSKTVSEDVFSRLWNSYLVVDSLVVEYLICKYGYEIRRSFLESFNYDCVYFLYHQWYIAWIKSRLRSFYIYERWYFVVGLSMVYRPRLSNRNYIEVFLMISREISMIKLCLLIWLYF